MIVSCPSCHTRYRHGSAAQLHAALGQCSRCEDSFPLEPARRTYVLRSAEPAASSTRRRSGRMTIGMDDPLLADRVRSSALDGGGGSASHPLTYTTVAPDSAASVADDAVFAAPPVAPPLEDLTLDAVSREVADRDLPVIPAGVEHLESNLETPVETPLGEVPAEARPRERDRVLELLVAVLPASYGAALAYYLAGRHGGDPVTWCAIGGAAGFLLGWVCLRWIRRKV